jgi:hypothetical protein
MNRKLKGLVEAFRGQILASYQDGQSVTAICRDTGLYPYHVRGVLREAGITPRTLAEENRRRAVPIDKVRLLSLVDQKLSTTEIARDLGLTQPTIEMKLRRMGVRSKHGRGSKMEKNYFWKGGRRIDEDGYVLVKSPGHPHATKAGYVREHRLVMEKALGRYLRRNEVVHHRNKDKQDNRIENLELFATNGAHLKQELTGKTPKYTSEGLQRMRENARRVNLRRYGANHRESKSGSRK